MPTIALAIGTRPDAIKLAPVAAELAGADSSVTVEIYSSGQHRQMIRPVLEIFSLDPTVDLDVMEPGQQLSALTGKLIDRAGAALAERRPDRLLVQGDSTTGAGFAWASFLNGIPVAHVEAGLRTYDVDAPWPEEVNRRIITLLADMHFAPTEEARSNLAQEGVAEDRIWVTGNTVVDALRGATGALSRNGGPPSSVSEVGARLDGRMVLVTGHRRENIGSPLEDVCGALRDVVAEHEDVDVVFSTHLNPSVKDIVYGAFDGVDRIHLIPPVDYLGFVWLMRRATLIVTDSGGIQEEAPSLGVPVVVTRRSTERPEGLKAGASVLAGSGREEMATSMSRLLSDREAYERMAQRRDVYGDGEAAARIVDALISALPQSRGET